MPRRWLLILIIVIVGLTIWTWAGFTLFDHLDARPYEPNPVVQQLLGLLLILFGTIGSVMLPVAVGVICGWRLPYLVWWRWLFVGLAFSCIAFAVAWLYFYIVGTRITDSLLLYVVTYMLNVSRDVIPPVATLYLAFRVNEWRANQSSDV